MFYVYIIDNKKQLYIGFTHDLKRRIKEHNANKSLPTKNKGGWDLIYYEAHRDERDAKRREHYLKTSMGCKALRRMMTHSLASRKTSFGN